LGLLPTLREQRVDPRVVVTTTPKPVTLLRRLVEEPSDRGSVAITRGSTFDNADNLAPRFLSEMTARYEGTRRGRQELHGELLTDVEGALVSQDMIDGARMRDVPPIQMVRTVVAIDPATTTGEDSDETGIIVVAKGIDNRGYVLADLSCKKSPDGWAKVACNAYTQYGADRIVAEKNQGGDMVEHTVRSVNPNVAYKGVAAKVGKKLRAEPVAALYEQGKVTHVGVFEQLEDQWTTWIPDAAAHQKSPDRVDALVHGITELGLIGLPDAHFAAQLQRDHPPCQACSTPSPKGTPICPKCGAQREDGVTEAPEESEVEAWSRFAFGSTNVQPNQHTATVMDLLNGLQNQQGKWWHRR
jgi:phage terminase large subunit-like protein